MRSTENLQPALAPFFEEISSLLLSTRELLLDDAYDAQVSYNFINCIVIELSKITHHIERLYAHANMQDTLHMRPPPIDYDKWACEIRVYLIILHLPSKHHITLEI